MNSLFHASSSELTPAASVAAPLEPGFTTQIRRGSVAKGCLIAAAVVLVIVIAIGAWVAFSWKGWVAAGIKTAAVQAIGDSQLPQDQKDRLNTRISGLADDFGNGKLTFTQLGEVMQQVATSPLLPLAMVYSAETAHVQSSALSDEEKTAAKRSIARFARGLVDGSISPTAVDDVLTHVATRKPNNNQFELKPTVTIDEVKAFVATAKSKADEAKVPDEDYQINFADEVDKVIDAGLKQPA
jgi:hypothetical protein